MPLAFAASCGKQEAQSSLDGRYEGTNADAVEPFRNNQRAVPEYAPSQGVIISLPFLNSYGKDQTAADMLKTDITALWIVVPSDYKSSLQGADFSSLRRLAGSSFSKVKLLKQRTPGPVTVWARDWSPLPAKGSDGVNLLLDFNYYPNRPTDDFTAQSFFGALPLDRVSIPVYNEGGNFMVNSDGVCMMTTRVTDANKSRYYDTDMVLNNEQIKSYYRDFAGCSDVHIFPRIPYEGTGHIDIWAKFLNNKTVIVNEIRDEILNLDGYKSDSRQKAQVVKSFLDSRAQEIESLGFNVIRIPMPAPVFSNSGPMFRSYTNSLTLNDTIFIPNYVSPAYEDLGIQGEYVDQELLNSYEREVLGLHKQVGYGVTWVTSDDTMANGGAIHCTTMQLAR